MSEEASEEEILKFLQSVHKADFDSTDKSEYGLVKPKAPSSWVFFATKDKDQGLKADLYRWRNKTKRRDRKKKLFLSLYYIAVPPKTEGGIKMDAEEDLDEDVDYEREQNLTVPDKQSDQADCNSGFQKWVYYLKKPTSKNDPMVVLYKGDHTLAKDFPHGNSRKDNFFLTTEETVKELIKTRCKEKGKSVEIFKDVVKDCLNS